MKLDRENSIPYKQIFTISGSLPSSDQSVFLKTNHEVLSFVTTGDMTCWLHSFLSY